MSAAEAGDIRRFGGFRPGAGVMETKLFATSLANALRFGALLYTDAGLPFIAVEIAIPADFADTLDGFIADRMWTIAVYPEQLDALNRVATIRFLSATEENIDG